MNIFEKLMIAMPAFADAVLLAYVIAMPYSRVSSAFFGQFCALLPIITGVLVLVGLPILARTQIIPKRSPSIPIAATLSVVGIIEPYVFY